MKLDTSQGPLYNDVVDNVSLLMAFELLCAIHPFWTDIIRLISRGGALTDMNLIGNGIKSPFQRPTVRGS